MYNLRADDNTKIRLSAVAENPPAYRQTGNKQSGINNSLSDNTSHNKQSLPDPRYRLFVSAGYILSRYAQKDDKDCAGPLDPCAVHQGVW